MCSKARHSKELVTEIQNRDEATPNDPGWVVYMVRCVDGSLYTGITTDIDRRVHEHNHNTRSAAYTRARRPVELVYQEACADRSAASRREYAIRRLSVTAKRALIR